MLRCGLGALVMLAGLIWVLGAAGAALWAVAGYVWYEGITWWVDVPPYILALVPFFLGGGLIILAINVSEGHPKNVYLDARYVGGEWIIDSDDQLQKVDATVRGARFGVSRSREERAIEEAYELKRRRSFLWWAVPAAFATGMWEYGIIFGNDRSAFNGPAPIVVGVVALIFIGGSIYYLGVEYLYLAGYQNMKGAKVLDRKPRRVALQNIAEEQVHGAARVVGRDEARDVLNPKKR
jgi:hypothetical protein